MTTTMDHVPRTGNLCGADTAIQQPLKLLTPKLLSSIAEEKEQISFSFQFHL